MAQRSNVRENGLHVMDVKKLPCDKSKKIIAKKDLKNNKTNN